jgi:uncharacterized protein
LNKYIFIYFGFVFVASISSCFTFRKSDHSTLKKVSKFGIELKAKYFSYKGKFCRYFHFENNKKELPLLVILHGAPGSSSNFTDFLKNSLITDHYSVILVDRLGYGYSDYGHYATIKEQSELLVDLINKEVKENQEVFIAGHSYGGTIAAAITSLHPKFLTASVLMAPALDPVNEKYFWFGKLGKWKATRWMASGALKVATDEKYNHAKELELWHPKWKNISTPVLHIHGNKDKLVPFVNIQYSKTNIPVSHLEVYEWEGMNHFFPFSKTNQTAELLHEYFSRHKSYLH